ncbi:aldo/keto reductase [Algicella marina]|uniref:Aldo/keto reductase n=1 Tax=Algicella marina TaxID=2683284 RepID=A0A6P1SYP4_9RHOB|nr:aldo/keto reductase [Algicella marina]QHQ34740.1 aldo/keto reductase [Algicella marina]
MKMNPLGRTGITVSEICLGTMTWGNQNTEAEAHEQMDYALGEGVSFWDTAEVYPAVPISAETQGATEEYIGSWFKSRGRRDDVILASKVAGIGVGWIQDGAAISSTKIAKSIEGSLKRLQTDYIDLYQLHWPNRGHYHFRRQWSFDPSQQARDVAQDTADILGELGRQVEAGKIRAIGLSNDSAWGTAQFLKIAEEQGLPRVASIQNEYSLLYRTFDLDLAELAHHEDVGLLAYSPLASGILSAKYSNGAIPKGSRGDREPMGRRNETSTQAADEYAALARNHGLDPCAMAIAFCLTRPFMTSAIIGATSIEQLKIAISAHETDLSDEVLDGIAALHKKYPAPF